MVGSDDRRPGKARVRDGVGAFTVVRVAAGVGFARRESGIEYFGYGSRELHGSLHSATKRLPESRLARQLDFEKECKASTAVAIAKDFHGQFQCSRHAAALSEPDG